MNKTYTLLSGAPEFVKGVQQQLKTAALRTIVKDLGIECGDSTLYKAVRAVKESAAGATQNTPPVSADEWTLPTTKPQSSTRIAELIATKQAPARGNQWQRFMVGFDVHGDMQCPESNAAFFRHMEMFAPELRIMGGDLWDYRPMRNGVNAEERQESMARDYLAGLEWLQRFAPQHFLRGNHDERLWDWAYNKRGIEQDFARGKVDHIESEVEKLGCRMYPYHIREGILKIGSLQVAHGFYNGVNCARQMATDYGCILFGHNHVVQVQPVPNLERKAARCMGALCQLVMSYNERRPSTLRHANGWGYGVLSRTTGNYHVWQAERIEGVWIVPSDVVEL